LAERIDSRRKKACWRDPFLAGRNEEMETESLPFSGRKLEERTVREVPESRR
jgi:hypothetical protein